MVSLADVKTTCMSLYNFCVPITSVQSLFLRCFSLDHWFTVHSTPETKTKLLKTISRVSFVCMYVCMNVKLVIQTPSIPKYSTSEVVI